MPTEDQLVEIEDDDRQVPIEVARKIRLALGIATEPELATALNENPRTTQSKRVTGSDVLPHIRRGRSVLYILPLVGDELRRRAEQGTSLEVVHRAGPRRRRAI